MIDAITFTSDLPGFRKWLAENQSEYPQFIGIDGDGNCFLISSVSLDKTPTFTNGDNSVSLIRTDSLDFINASPLEILAQCPMGEDPFVLMTPESKAKYDMAYPRPIIEVPESTFMGNIRPAYTYQVPERFGGFA